MKNIIKSLIVVIAVAAISGGATYSYFSDQAEVTGNTFSAGTIDLKTNNADGVEKAYSVGNLKPGSWDLSGQVVLKNAGTIKGHAWLEIKNVQNYENECVSPEVTIGDTSCGTGDDQGELGQFIKASFQKNVAPWTRYGGSDPINVEAGKKIDLFDLNPGESVPVVLYATWHDHTANDNMAQGDSAKFDVIFHLDQI